MRGGIRGWVVSDFIQSTPGTAKVHACWCVDALGATRPDLCYVTNMLCRVMCKPDKQCLEAAYRVLCYLDRHSDIGLTYEPHKRTLSGMSDADWAEIHSTTGGAFTWQNALLSWSSKKQKSVALSSAESEIMAASDATKEVIFLRRLLAELGVQNVAAATKLYVDNKAAIDLAYNPEHHQRTKHINRRHFFIREKVEEHELVVPFVKTSDNYADFFTKALDRPRAVLCDPQQDHEHRFFLDLFFR